MLRVYLFIVDKEIKFNHPGHAGSMNKHFVKRAMHLFTARNLTFQQKVIFCREIPLQNCADLNLNLVGRHVGQKSQPTPIDP